MKKLEKQEVSDNEKPKEKPKKPERERLKDDRGLGGADAKKRQNGEHREDKPRKFVSKASVDFWVLDLKFISYNAFSPLVADTRKTDAGSTGIATRTEIGTGSGGRKRRSGSGGRTRSGGGGGSATMEKTPTRRGRTRAKKKRSTSGRKGRIVASPRVTFKLTNRRSLLKTLKRKKT